MLRHIRGLGNNSRGIKVRLRDAREIGSLGVWRHAVHGEGEHIHHGGIHRHGLKVWRLLGPNGFDSEHLGLRENLIRREEDEICELRIRHVLVAGPNAIEVARLTGWSL